MSPTLSPPLGGLAPARFLAEYWHKQPLLIRAAVPGFGDALDAAGMRVLAARDDVEARLVSGRGRDWALQHGPFRAADFKRLPARDWTLLVQSVDHHLPDAAALLRRFGFLPHARLDDVMVSLAADGGSVGPHFDSYDVFLLQGTGKRRWQISAQEDLALLPDAPLKILKRFKPEQEWLLEPGDMLYLPPHYAHHGEAVGACMTWSIGFRAPAAQELGQAFLEFLADRLELDGRYADPGLKLPRHPAELSPALVKQIAGMLKAVRWDAGDIADFVGEYLSEPKPGVYFTPPAEPLTAARFARAAARGVTLDARTRMLFRGARFFVNGEAFDVDDASERAALVTLADTRELAHVPRGLVPAFYDWYAAGWLAPVDPDGSQSRLT